MKTWTKSYTELDAQKIHPIFNMDEEGEGGVITVNKHKTALPRKYKVFLHNDDYTTMEFVVYVLKRHFHKTVEEAQEIMLKVHHEGLAVCGIYTFEVAETKVDKVTKDAEENGHPLLCTMEPE
ncbi:MAG: ATP-dependent Clp protease adapter ClpS [Bdellovibrio sp. CG11_big_fil_rev_8_21_14_0_20_39_38]|nr:MAG: ATP-dependent Clp protease adapter ClpS [Bdellovibrio sp. CG22_combo_CG10-13_8_21_14_all_39_27]PIR36321.1 MAG: ATP-dependent Clp protease adapter ClpS [Bdellovibrio sp. CG11_big_fil_rev_8_21_14_0_20_39_38]